MRNYISFIEINRKIDTFLKQKQQFMGIGQSKIAVYTQRAGRSSKPQNSKPASLKQASQKTNLFKIPRHFYTAQQYSGFLHLDPRYR